jgi:hypothetical protein
VHPGTVSIGFLEIKIFLVGSPTEALYIQALEILFMCMFNGKRRKSSHFPLGVAKDPSPLMRADAECVIDPPVTEEGGKTRMPLSITLFDVFGGVR